MVKNILKNAYLAIIKFLATKEMQKHKEAQVIGITGSSGKSSCKSLVVAFLKPHYGTRLKYCEKGNSETGIPYEILNIPVKNYQMTEYLGVLLKAIWNFLFSKQEFDVFVIEYGIDGPEKPYNMEYLLEIVKPDIAVLLSISGVHGFRFEKDIPESVTGNTRQHLIAKGIASEKVKLLQAVPNKKKAFYSEQSSKFLEEKQISGMTQLSESDSVKIKQWKNTSKGCTISCDIHSEVYTATLPEVALANSTKDNFLFAIYVTLLLKKNLQTSFDTLAHNYYVDPGRASLLPGIRGTLILDSSYNANELAVSKLFSIVDEIAKDESRKRCIVLGEFRELGSVSPEVHERIVKEATKHADTLILTNNIMREVGIPVAEEAGFTLNENLFWFENGKQLSYHITELVDDESIILFEGSQNTVFLEYAVKEMLLNKSEEYIKKKLARMSDDWMKLKNS